MPCSCQESVYLNYSVVQGARRWRGDGWGWREGWEGMRNLMCLLDLRLSNDSHIQQTPRGETSRYNTCKIAFSISFGFKDLFHLYTLCHCHTNNNVIQRRRSVTSSSPYNVYWRLWRGCKGCYFLCGCYASIIRRKEASKDCELILVLKDRALRWRLGYFFHIRDNNCISVCSVFTWRKLKSQSVSDLFSAQVKWLYGTKMAW